MIDEIRERGVPGFHVDVIGTDPHVDRRLPSVVDAEIPFYPGLHVGVPGVPDLVEALAEGRYDLVHVSAPGPVGAGGAATARMLGLPVAGSHHTEFAAYAQLRTGDPRIVLGMQLALGALYQQCAVVLSPSAAADATLAGLGVDAARIARWDRGVDTERFTPARREAGAAGRVTVLHAGRLTREKGVDLLAEAFLAARARDPRLHLVLAGGGPEEERLRARLGDAASFLGWLEGEALATAYASADVLLFCSRTDTFGQVVLEAQASGLPVVAVGEGGPAELIADGRSGLLCPARPEPLAAARRRPGGIAGDARAARPRRPGRGPRAHVGPRPRPPCGRLACGAGAPRRRRGAADGMTRERQIAVAIHDVEPATFERCALIRDWLDDHGVDRATLLVIPAPDLHPFFQRRPDLAAWLLDCRDRGDAIAQHGFRHRAAGRRPAAEFARLDKDQTQASIAAGRRVLAMAGVEPRGFVAPGYAYTPGAAPRAGARLRLVGDAAALRRPRPPRDRARRAAPPLVAGPPRRRRRARARPAARPAPGRLRPPGVTCSRSSRCCAARAGAPRSPTTTCADSPPRATGSPGA